MGKWKIQMKNVNANRPVLPPKLEYHKLYLSEFADVLMERTADLLLSYPELPVDLIKALVLEGVREEIQMTPNIEVIIDVI
jgi:urease gamma subunit